jgi:hypothetical protein
MADNRPQSARQAYGDRYSSSRSSKDSSSQTHSDKGGSKLGTSTSHKDGPDTYYGRNGSEIKDKVK